MAESGMREPNFLVLTALAEKPQHGYAIIRDVEELSDGRIKLHTGSLYAMLDRLREAGLIEIDREEVVESRLRRYYRLTNDGIARLVRETAYLQRAAAAATARLKAGRRLASEGNP
jgi:DNA-binding PadR family transcriptional regulator